MKIIKNINSNFALAVDDNGSQLIITGKGVGFGKIPRELNDLKQIERSFYNVEDPFVKMINDLPQEVIEISINIVDYARMKIKNQISSNIVFSLADHINFCIQRFKKNMNINLPIVYDIENLFDEEMEVGKYALQLINQRYSIRLPKEEASYIALHIVNSEEKEKTKEDLNNRTIEKITEIIESQLNINIERSGFSYSRFVTHLHYLLKRFSSKHLLNTENGEMFKTIKNTYPEVYECVKKIDAVLKEERNIELTDEENLYLMLHINRLNSREL